MPNIIRARLLSAFDSNGGRWYTCRVTSRRMKSRKSRALGRNEV